jgi:HD superfamily phosphohydrolase YqeK
MKSAYEILKSDTELNYIFDNVNCNLNNSLNFVNGTVDVIYNFCCHGRHHSMFVVGLTEYILSELSYDNHTIELGKVAGLLHDIGNFYGRGDHAAVSSQMCLHFISKTYLNLNDLRIIEQAVLDHSKGVDFKSAVGAALFIADKVTDRERAIPLREDLIKSGFSNEAELTNHANKYIKPSTDQRPKYKTIDFTFIIENRDLIYNYFVEGDTEAYIEEYIIKKKRPIRILTQKAADYLECNCIYKVNGKEVKIVN